MDFTREPIIETVVTPREGCKLVLRNSKNPSQEEYFVDALEVVSFGEALFYRSLERPKAFLLPVTDYEVLEVRETRMVLKNVGVDKTIKIGGGREAPRPPREEREKAPRPEPAPEAEPRSEKKRERRRSHRRRRGRDDKGVEETKGGDAPKEKEKRDRTETGSSDEGNLQEKLGFSTPSFSSLLPPPPKLISETIEKYKSNSMYKGAFFQAKEEAEEEEQGERPELDQPDAEDPFAHDLPKEQEELGSLQENQETETESQRPLHELNSESPTEAEEEEMDQSSELAEEEVGNGSPPASQKEMGL